MLAFTLPDPVPINPIAKGAALRLRNLNLAVRDLAAKHGAYLVDLEAHPVSSDRRLWHLDRLHANPSSATSGSRSPPPRRSGSTGADARWTTPFADPLDPRTRVSHAVWAGKYLAPWVIRRLRGVSSGDGITAKRPNARAAA